MELDLSNIPSDTRYEDRYRQYLDVFKNIAAVPGTEQVTVFNAPYCWHPLLHHLNCALVDGQTYFPHCPIARAAMECEPNLDRTAIEVLCGFRPECVDALYKVDMQWKCARGRVREYPRQREFIITTNGGFHRPEILQYRAKFLASYRPPKNKVLLVPCAADKPYPSPMHKACLDRLPPDFYLMNVTTVLGLVPQDLWAVMPWYDSGIPYHWRLFDTITWYFQKHEHIRIVVYCDFLSETIEAAFNHIDQIDRTEFILPVEHYDDYADLMQPALLQKLELVLKR